MTLYFKFRALIIQLLMKILPFRSPMVLRGPGSSVQLCEQIGMLGIKRLLIVTDKVLYGAGLLADMETALQSAGIEVERYDGVLPDPTFAQVQEGAAVLRAKQCEAILAVGGGSVMDAAKMMSILHTNPGDLQSFLPVQRCKNPGLPLFAVPTTAGTGSEITPVAVITDADTHQKTPVIETKMMPGHVALDAQIMSGMPPAITAATGMDALTHAVESCLSTISNPETEMQAVAAVRLIFSNLPRAFEAGSDLAARDAMALAAFYAAAAFSRTSVGYVHAIAHQLGTVCGTPHGNANAMLLPEVLTAYGSCVHPQLAQLGAAIGLADASQDDAANAQRFIQAVVELRAQLQLPTQPVGLGPEHIPAMVKAAKREAGELYPVPRYLQDAELTALVRGLLPNPQP